MEYKRFLVLFLLIALVLSVLVDAKKKKKGKKKKNRDDFILNGKLIHFIIPIYIYIPYAIFINLAGNDLHFWVI